MKRNRTIFALCFLAVLAVLALWWLLRALQHDARSQAATEPASSPAVAPPLSGNLPTEEQKKEEIIDIVAQAYQTPIKFYGRVVDQYGESVTGANVTFAPIYSLMSNTKSYTGSSDNRGYFSIENIQGIALSVGVRKEGYYPVKGKSANTFAYGIGTDAYRKSPPTKDNPAIFILHKMGEREPLVPISSRTYHVSRDGTPIEINLASGRIVPVGNGDLRVETWTDDRASGKVKGYQWRCRVTVPGGGLVERKGQFDFEAPKDGYKESVELGMPGDAEHWTSQQQREYFVKLSNKCFARIKFIMIAGGDHFFRLESYLNPTPGSRNLEYDPKKRIRNPEEM